MSRLLIIEDDLDLQEGLSFSLQAEGYETVCAGSMREGMELLQEGNVELVLLDCNLPDGSGFDCCRSIREHRQSPDSQIPILMLTARDMELDEVKALELGASDYMRKPFSLAVLKARIKKLLQHQKQPHILTSNAISLDKDKCRVFRGEEELACSRIEYKLLLCFMEHKNQVLSKEQILEQVWDADGRFVDEGAVAVNIRRLRTKIEEDPAEPKLLQTVYGLGYIWKEG